MVGNPEHILLTDHMLAELRRLKLEQDWSNKDLAETVGIHRNGLSKILNGHTQHITRPVWQALCWSIDGLDDSWRE